MSALIASPPEAGTFTLRLIENILDKKTRRTEAACPGRKLYEYIPIEWSRDPNLGCIFNGEALRGEQLRRVAFPGDELILYRIPGVETFFIPLLISLVISGIVYGIQALTAPAAPSLERDLEDDPTYGFDGIVNTVRPGTRQPIIYGTHRYGGHIISQFLRPAQDTTHSDADPQVGELHTLLGVCAGPIEGIDSIRIDRNPATDFRGVRIETRLGGMFQRAIDGFQTSVQQKSKNQDLKQVAGAITFTTETECDAFEVILRFTGGLFKATSNGGFGLKSVEILFEYRIAGSLSEWTLLTRKAISANARNPFDSWTVSGPLKRAQYEIRLTRITNDDNSVTGISDCQVLAINEVLDAALSYPGLALLAVRQLPNNQVSGRAPTYDALVKGRQVRVFSNLTTYTKVWSDNPAWCLLDFLTDPLFGLGAWISDAQIDLQSFLDLATFCTNEAFRLNMVVDGSMTAMDVIKQICSTARCFFILRGDTWSVRPDQPEEPVQLFSMGRINKGSFSVTKASRADTANFFFGEFWNAELDYEQDQLPRDDPTLSEDVEQIEATVNLMGTTDAEQAKKHLNFFMLSNRLLKRTVEFEAGVEAIALEAGDVFLVAHDVPGWGFSGRIVSVEGGGSLLRLDREVTIAPATLYELTVIHATDKIDVLRVTNNPGTTELISVSLDWTTMPVVGLDYSFGEVTKSTVSYRCTSISRGSGFLKRKIRAREYDEDIYGTDLTVLPDPTSSRLQDPNRIPSEVRDLRLNERTAYAQDGTISIAIDVHFTLPIEPGARAQVFWREKGSLIWDVSSSPIDYGYWSITDNVQSPGVTYEVSVVTLSSSGIRRHPDAGVVAEILTKGVTRQPDKVANFRVDRTVTGLIFSWDPIDPVRNFDLDHYELRAGTLWETAVRVGRTSDTVIETGIFVKGTQTFLLKAFNSAGVESAEAASVVITVEGRVGENIVLSRQEETSWTGTKQNFSVSSGKLVLSTLGETVGWRGILQAPTVGSMLIPGGRKRSFRLSGIYTTAAFQVTSGNAVRCLVSTDLEVNQVDTTAYWSASGLSGQTWQGDYASTRTWGTAPNSRVTTRVEMRFSTSGSNDSDFGPWQERLQNIEVAVKWAQARILCEILDPVFTVEVVRFKLLFDVPDIADSGSVSTSSGGTTPVTFGKLYNNAPKVTATVIGATAGDEVFLTNKTATGFDIAVKNAGAFVVRTVNWVALGF